MPLWIHSIYVFLRCGVNLVQHESLHPLEPQPQVLSSTVYFKLHSFSTESAPVATKARPYKVWYGIVYGVLSILI